MYLFGKRVDALDETDIRRLIDNSIQETTSLDYKRDFNMSNDKDKKEFLFDVTAMANSDGGILIFGIEEKKDEKKQNTGTPEKIVGIEITNYDKLVQQIEDTVKTGTEPNISKIGIKRIVVDGMNVLILGISKTLGLPVMVTFSGSNRFYRRRNSGKYTVDVYELNQMFLQNQVLKESAENFKMDRINKVLNLKAFPVLERHSSLFVHIIPFSFQNEKTLDFTGIETMNLPWMPMFTRGYDMMFNADGYAIYSASGATQTVAAYDQLIRNGVYEAYSGTFIEPYNPSGSVSINRIVGTDYIKTVLDKVKSAMSILKRFNVEPPFIINISLIGIRGTQIYQNSYWGKEILTNEIFFPAVIIPSYDTEIYPLLKPGFDILWQAAGKSSSPPIS